MGALDIGKSVANSRVFRKALGVVAKC